MTQAIHSPGMHNIPYKDMKHDYVLYKMNVKTNSNNMLIMHQSTYDARNKEENCPMR